MAQNYFDQEATTKMNEEYSNYMSSLPKTSLKGFSIPKLEKSELQNKLLNMAMSGQDMQPTFSENTAQQEQTWSRPAAPPVENGSKKRTFQETSNCKSWANDYDKPIPDSVLDLCLEDECKICGVQILNFLQRKQHYDGSKHEKKVRLELQEIYKNDEERPLKRGKIDMNSSAEMFLKKIENHVSRDASNLTMADFQLSAWQKERLESWDRPLPPQIISMCRITKCDVCESTFTSVIMAQAHFEGKNHEKKLKVCLEAFCQKNGLETPRKVADTAALSEDFCKCCEVALSSPAMARIHYAGKQHTKKKQAEIALNPTGVVQDETGRFGIGAGFHKETPKPEELGDDLKETLKVSANEEGMDGTWGSEKTTEEQRFQSVVNPNVSFSYPIKKFSPFSCKICNIDMSSKATYDIHIAGKNHKKKENSINQPTKGEFFCDVCNLQLSALVTFEAHIRGKQHAKRVGAAERPDSGQFYCDVCFIQCSSEIQFQMHNNSKKHQSKLSGNQPPSGGFKCDVCSITTSDQNGLTMHLNGKNHQAKLRKINGSSL
eukprot:GFUD01011542.1.p1 GENE.GFUD01011542.1~~GFUD01011542.1.p1  ORF type:complete len:547 (+),score=131.39 GFUD01011542.1:33-1673(+)